jgi:hypothetical protein
VSSRLRVRGPVVVLHKTGPRPARGLSGGIVRPLTKRE